MAVYGADPSKCYDIEISNVSLVLKGTIGRGETPRKKAGRLRYGLAFILSGSARYAFDDETLAVERGAVMLLAKDSNYAISVDSDDYAFIYADFEVDSLANIPLDSAVYSLRNDETIEHLFYKLDRCWLKKLPNHQLKAKALLYEIFSLMIEEQTAAYIPSAKYKMIEPAISYMDDHFTDHTLTTAALARLAGGISPVHFRRVFKELYLIPPHKYLNLLRIRRAKDLLRYQLYTVTQVADMTGFSNVYYFSQVFKKETGKSPLEFARSSQN